MGDALKGRRDEAKRAIGTTLLLLDYADTGTLAHITEALQRINRGLSQRARAASEPREEVVANV